MTHTQQPRSLADLPLALREELSAIAGDQIAAGSDLQEIISQETTSHGLLSLEHIAQTDDQVSRRIMRRARRQGLALLASQPAPDPETVPVFDIGDRVTSDLVAGHVGTVDGYMAQTWTDHNGDTHAGAIVRVLWDATRDRPAYRSDIGAIALEIAQGPVSHPAATSQTNGGLGVGQSVSCEVRYLGRPGVDISSMPAQGAIRRAQVTAPADTFFSIPARVSIAGRKIRGYLTISTVAGFSTSQENDPSVYVFVPFNDQGN